MPSPYQNPGRNADLQSAVSQNSILLVRRNETAWGTTADGCRRLLDGFGRRCASPVRGGIFIVRERDEPQSQVEVKPRPLCGSPDAGLAPPEPDPAAAQRRS